MTKGPVTPVLWYSKVEKVAGTGTPPPGLQTLRWSLILTTLVALCCTTLTIDAPRSVSTPPAVEVITPAAATPAEDAKPAKPDSPMPKVAASNEETGSGAGAESATPSGRPMLNSAVQPATAESYETPRKRAIWYGLMAAGHGAAAFDAWTTRRAVTSGYGVEADPLQQPFAHSGAIYATTQVSPLVMDYLGHRMMRSHYTLMRRLWWVPQAASASFSLGAGIHNYGVVH